ncbi:amidohydrolase family protein [Amycolatopsis sp. GM8]|uniref:amidohydrolase family protein n=1 Tax=Amycolatopsis sp. GM8 TaxID=2896530 RepID=UPI001F36E859|nr:amidohydrolase family protein [Amycolatopsis sp. GM8]
MTQRCVVVSSDSHAGADLRAYKPYLEQKWHDEFEEWAKNYHNPWEFLDPVETEERLKIAVTSWHSPRNWDTERRVKDMDADGIAAEVVFPNTAPPFLPTTVLTGAPPKTREEYERRWAGLRAHNRWLVDFCAASPGRRAGVAQVMLYDIDDTVAEIRRTNEDGLRGGIIIPADGAENTTIPLYRPEYEPLWAVCEELGVPIHRHGIPPACDPDLRAEIPGIAAMGVAEMTFFNARSLTQLIFSGVFERHPDLKFVLTETSIGWVPAHLAMLDQIFASREAGGMTGFVRESLAELTMTPSEYFRRNCWLGASLLERREIEMREAIGFDRIMWGQDYPHAEGTFPYSLESHQLVMTGLPENEVRAMLGDTAIDLYGLDGELLHEVADRIGPTIAEINTAPTSLPRVPEDSWCPTFR